MCYEFNFNSIKRVKLGQGIRIGVLWSKVLLLLLKCKDN